MPFHYDLDFKHIDFRRCPKLYRIGKSEQGVLLVEPYKGEILPHWRFKTPAIAHRSADAIYQLYLRYKAADDFVGMDMARKFLQMGYTRARRYANHRSGRKYAADRHSLLPLQPDPAKAAAADIFRERWRLVCADPEYRARQQRHRALYERA